MGQTIDVIGYGKSNHAKQGSRELESRAQARQIQEKRRQAIKMRKKQRRKRKIAIFTIRLCVCMIAVVALFTIIKKCAKNLDGFSMFQRSMEQEAEELTTPVMRTDSEVITALKTLSEEQREYQTIYENVEEYPEELLAALINNPEMLEFVQNYPTSEKKVTGGLNMTEKMEEYPLFLQWDSRWGYASYGSSNIALSGCGPTCLSMVVYALTRDSEITPDKVAEYAADEGYYVAGSGTLWSLMADGADWFGITGTERSLDKGIMEEQLDAGHPIICVLGAGDFTISGHFIMLYDYDENGFFVNDPNSRIRSAKQWTFDELNGQVRNLWSYEKK